MNLIPPAPENYRFYSFVNFYLSSIQQGIQTAHLTAEMFITNDGPPLHTLHKWAKNDKVMITLNGGANFDIMAIYDFLQAEKGMFSWEAPIGKFHEDDYSLGGVMTCCGLVVPERIWGAMDYKRSVEKELLDPASRTDSFYFPVFDADGKQSGSWAYTPETADFKLISMLKSCPLAR